MTSAINALYQGLLVGGDEGIDELVSDCGLGEYGGTVLVVVSLEELDKVNDLGGSGHRR